MGWYFHQTRLPFTLQPTVSVQIYLNRFAITGCFHLKDHGFRSFKKVVIIIEPVLYFIGFTVRLYVCSRRVLIAGEMEANAVAFIDCDLHLVGRQPCNCEILVTVRLIELDAFKVDHRIQWHHDAVRLKVVFQAYMAEHQLGAITSCRNHQKCIQQYIMVGSTYKKVLYFSVSHRLTRHHFRAPILEGDLQCQWALISLQLVSHKMPHHRVSQTATIRFVLELSAERISVSTMELHTHWFQIQHLRSSQWNRHFINQFRVFQNFLFLFFLFTLLFLLFLLFIVFHRVLIYRLMIHQIIACFVIVLCFIIAIQCFLCAFVRCRWCFLLTVFTDTDFFCF